MLPTSRGRAASPPGVARPGDLVRLSVRCPRPVRAASGRPLAPRAAPDHGPNLSISVSPGADTERDSPSSGERSGSGRAPLCGPGAARADAWKGAGSTATPRCRAAALGAVALLESAARTGGVPRPRLNTRPGPIAHRVARANGEKQPAGRSKDANPLPGTGARRPPRSARAPFARLETRIKELRRAASGPGPRARAARAPERPGADPKGGDLCAATAKPAERLVEAGSGSDVQILPRSCVKGRKTHRTA